MSLWVFLTLQWHGRLVRRLRSAPPPSLSSLFSRAETASQPTPESGLQSAWDSWGSDLTEMKSNRMDACTALVLVWGEPSTCWYSVTLRQDSYMWFKCRQGKNTRYNRGGLTPSSCWLERLWRSQWASWWVLEALVFKANETRPFKDMVWRFSNHLWRHSQFGWSCTLIFQWNRALCTIPYCSHKLVSGHQSESSDF